MTHLRFDIADLRRSIDALLVSFPELENDETLRADMFEAETALSDVLAKLVSEAMDAKMMATAVKLHMDELSARKARHERREEAMRSLMQSLLERADLRKVTLPEATLSITHRAPAPVIDDEKALPAACTTLTPKPNMGLIRGWMEFHDGQPPPGVHIDNGKTSLTIRTK